MTSTSAIRTQVAEERLVRVSAFRKAILRPELGAVAGAILVFIGFSLISHVFYSPAGIINFLDPASTLGIMAVSIGLLMIGGEFDLSAGVLTGSTGLVTALIVTELGVNVWLAMLVSLVFAIGVGLFNGYLVTKTNVPSFIITLGTYFMLQGLNYWTAKAVTNQVTVSGLSSHTGYDSAHAIFATNWNGFQITVFWWILATAIATYILLRTRIGNWIFAVGGAPQASRALGVPLRRTKMGLFVAVSVTAWFVGQATVLRYDSATVTTGIGAEFQYIIAAVIGGCLLTGGAGSAIGASIGALIFGMVSQGMPLVGLESELFKFFLGAILVAAVLVNLWVQSQATKAMPKRLTLRRARSENVPGGPEEFVERQQKETLGA